MQRKDLDENNLPDIRSRVARSSRMNGELAGVGEIDDRRRRRRWPESGVVGGELPGGGATGPGDGEEEAAQPRRGGRQQRRRRGRRARGRSRATPGREGCAWARRASAEAVRPVGHVARGDWARVTTDVSGAGGRVRWRREELD